MNQDAFWDLWLRFESGETLSADEERGVLETLEADPELRAKVLSDEALDGALRAMGATERDSETLAVEFSDRLQAEGDASRFIRKVEAQLQGAVAAKRTSNRRALRSARPANSSLSWPIGLAAAAVFIALTVTLASLTGPESAVRPPAPKESTRRPDLPVDDEARRQVAARARAERERLEAEAARGEEQRRLLAEAEAKARDEKERHELRAREAELAKTAAEVQEKLRAAREKERESVKAADPVAAPTEDKVDPPGLKPPTQTGIARVVRADVATLSGAPLKEGDEISADQRVEVGPGGQAVLTYPDKTRLQLGPETEAKEFSLQGGKRFTLSRGTLKAEVVKQPKDQPLIIATPHGQAKVLGTTFRMVVDPDPKKGTRLEVDEGRVELKRRVDSKPILVESGHYAVAAAGVDPASKPISPFVTVLSFDFEDGALPPDWVGVSVDPGPERPGRKGCLAVTEKGAVNPRMREARFERSFAYVEGMELRFEYWVKGGDDTLGLTLWDETIRESLEYKLPVKAQGKWTRAVVSLADFRRSGNSAPRVKEGHQVGNIYFGAGEPLKGAFYLDSIEVVKPRK